MDEDEKEEEEKKKERRNQKTDAYLLPRRVAGVACCLLCLYPERLEPALACLRRKSPFSLAPISSRPATRERDLGHGRAESPESGTRAVPPALPRLGVGWASVLASAG